MRALAHPRRPLLARLALLGAIAGVGGCLEGQAPSEETEQGLFQVFAPPSPAQAAAWAVDPYDPDKRQRGLLLLANAPFGGEPVYVETYLQALEDPDSAVRAVSVKALALHGSPEHAPRIAELLREDDEPLVRREAARALQRLHNERVVDALIAATDAQREEDIDVRASAARALGQYPDRRVVQALIAALSDRRLIVNREARTSLRILTGEDFGYDPAEWIVWTEGRQSLFAGRQPYEYPVFRRDPTIVEWLLPFWAPPNETPSRPVGMPRQRERAEQILAGAKQQQQG